MVPVSHRVVKDDSKEGTKNELKLKVFNNDVRLYLNPTEGILASENTPVWTVSSESQAPEGLQYKQVPKVRFDSRSDKRIIQTSRNVLKFNNIFKKSYTQGRCVENFY